MVLVSNPFVALFCMVLVVVSSRRTALPSDSIVAHYAEKHQDESNRILSLNFAVQNLERKDLLSQSDPLVKVDLLDVNDKKIAVGSTEIISNRQTAQFSKPVRLRYTPGTREELLIRVFDVDYKKDNATSKKETLIGYAPLKLSSIAKIGAGRLALRNIQQKETGFVNVASTELLGARLALQLSAEGIKSESWSLFHHPKHNLVLYRINRREGVSHLENEVTKSGNESKNHSDTQSGVLTRIYTTEDIGANPAVWKPTSLDIGELFGKYGDHEEFYVECYENGEKLLGGASLSMRDLIQHADQKIELIDYSQPENSNKRSRGYLVVKKADMILSEFRSFIASQNAELQMDLGIDFTTSNVKSEPCKSDEDCVEEKSEYQKVLEALNPAFYLFDDDQLYPVHGFGLRVPGGKGTEFDYNLSTPYDQVRGFKGILSAFKNAAKAFDASGPTYLSIMLKNFRSKVAQEAAHATSTTKYHVLWILTDGMIEDIDEVKQEIIAASQYPCSFVFIGIGDGDFSSLRALDGDNKSFASNDGHKPVRDVVQFVDFNDFNKDQASMNRLPLVATEEIAFQFASYIQQASVN